MLERFMPCLPRSTGLRPAHSPPPGALVMQPSTMIFSRARPGDAVVSLQRDLLEPGEDPGLDPLVAAVADGGGRAGAVGDRLVRAAEPQNLDQFPENDPVRDPRPVA